MVRNDASKSESTETKEGTNRNRSRKRQRTNKDSEESESDYWRQAELPDQLIARSLPLLRAVGRKLRGEDSANTTLTSEELAQKVQDLAANGTGGDNRQLNDQLYLWFLRDPEAAINWYNEQPNLDPFSLAISLTGNHLASTGEIQLGLDWTNLISDPAKRQDSIVMLYAGLLASQTITEAQIPAEIHSQVVTSGYQD